jgi:hypothetical protein
MPRDFDISPYFEIVKPTIVHGFDYTALHWADKQKPLQEVAGQFGVFPETVRSPPIVPEALDEETALAARQIALGDELTAGRFSLTELITIETAIDIENLTPASTAPRPGRAS